MNRCQFASCFCLLLTCRPVLPRSAVQGEGSLEKCKSLNLEVQGQVSHGQLTAARVRLTEALAESPQVANPSCVGLLLHNMATVLSLEGRLVEAEGFVKRAMPILSANYPPTSPLFLHPLQLEFSIYIEQGKVAKADAVFRRMQEIQTDGNKDLVLLHASAAVLLNAKHHDKQSESEYLATLDLCDMPDVCSAAQKAAIQIGLADLYTRSGQLDKAEIVLAHALTSLATAADTVPRDRIRILNSLALLSTRQGNWQKAEAQLREAISMADRNGSSAALDVRSLLINYSVVLHRNHNARETRLIDARVASISAQMPKNEVVDVSDLLAESNKSKH